MSKEQLVIETINKMIKSCLPIMVSDLNKNFIQKDNLLIEAEKENDKIGLKIIDKDHGIWGTSTLAIIATITDCLCDKRLAFQIGNGESDQIIGVQWHNNNDDQQQKRPKPTPSYGMH